MAQALIAQLRDVDEIEGESCLFSRTSDESCDAVHATR